MRQNADTEGFLRRIAETDGTTEDDLVAIRERHRKTTGYSPLTDQSIDAWRRFRQGQTLAEEDQAALEAIVVPNGLRPAFDVINDSFVDLPSPWTDVNAHRTFVERCIRGIGRIDIPGHASFNFAGTGFVVAEDLLLTNRHVAEIFCQSGANGMSFTPGVTPHVDFKQEVGSAATVTISITAPILVLPNWDAALLRVNGLPSGAVPLPLSSQPLADGNGRLSAIIGYPALDSETSADEIIQQLDIFRGVFDKKRMQPGRLLGIRDKVSFGQTVKALGHDCTTLGGSSGSALLDLESERIVGLHFDGDYLVANYAVPASALASEKRLHDEGVKFQD